MNWCKVGDKFMWHDGSFYCEIVEVSGNMVGWNWFTSNGEQWADTTRSQQKAIPENWLPLTPLTQALL
jgi:hypothetical protein